MGRHNPAKRRSRRLKVAIEPVCQFRAVDQPLIRREGIIVPARDQLARVSDPVSNISNPAYLQITPAHQENGTPLDIKRGDLFIRLKYFTTGTDTTDEQVITHATMTRVTHTLEVHHYEIQYNIFRILGDLS